MSHQHDMNCRELIDFIADYLEKSLPADQAQEFERHLNLCPSCVAYLDSYRTTIKLGRDAMTSPHASDCGQVPDGLLKAIRAARQSRPK